MGKNYLIFMIVQDASWITGLVSDMIHNKTDTATNRIKKRVSSHFTERKGSTSYLRRDLKM